MTGGLFYFCTRMKPANHKTILPMAYLPPISWYYFMMNSEEIYIEQYETYPKQTYRNRCQIYTERGVMPLSIPVTKLNGNHTLTRDVLISGTEKWQRHHWRSIINAYQNSPYFLYYRDEIETCFDDTDQTLLAFNTKCTQLLNDLIGIDKKILLTESYEHSYNDALDMRAISPKKKWYEGYFTPYLQVFSEKHGFIPDLSIIDLLFNFGPDTKAYLDNLLLKPIISYE